jgi:transcription elongation factor GreA
MTQRIPMTPAGLQKLRQELKHLREVDRPTNVRDIEEARAHGDISENAEYHAAKERQAWLDGRLKEIESKIALAEVIDPTKMRSARVVFGATVTLAETATDEEVTWSIVGDDEAEVKNGQISISSPLARALIGKVLDDTVVVETNRGRKEYEIIDLYFGTRPPDPEPTDDD